MIARTTRAKSGLSDYLEKGHREDSEYTREQKDNVIPIYGNLEIFRQTEQYLNREKNYKDNYLHITISYSKEDMQLMDTMSDDEKMAMKKDIALTYIKHHTSGYDIDNEVIAYVETHQPIIKFEHNKERLEHEHIAIALYNPLNDTKLQTTFHNNSFIDDTLQAYVNKKYGLSQPREHKRERQGIEADTQIAKDRKYYKEELKDIKSNSELIEYFRNNNIQYKEIKTKSNQYYKIINNSGKNINLKGKGFEHIHKVTLDKDFVYNEHKDIKELEKVLSSYYKKRIEQIDKRRSVSTKEAIKEIYKEQTKDNEHSLQSASYQQKIFYKHYKHMIDNDLKGYYIDTKEADNTKFINKQKNINIEDKGNKIVSNTNDKENINERVRLMLNVAEAKKWNINNLEINGTDDFKQEVEKQIAERIRLQEQLKKKNDKTLSYTEAVAVKQQIDKRPITATQTYKKKADQKQQQKAADKDISLSMFNNRQKPKNVIDFLQKEVNIKTSETIDITRELYKQQPLNIKSNKQERESNKMPMKLSICKDTNINALNKWETVQVKSYSELATVMKRYPYSMVKYGDKLTKKGNKRHNANILEFQNILIYDIDNDPQQKKLTLVETKELLKRHNISAMILPSKSHQIEKFTDSGKSKGIQDRFRIVIPINRSLKTNDIAVYKEFQKLTTKALGISQNVDKGISQNPSTFYYKSPFQAEPYVIRSDKVMNIDNLETKAINNINEQRAERAKEQQRIKQVKAEVSKYRTVQPSTNSNNLTYADTDKIMSLDIKSLINHYEKDAKSYKEGSYDMVKSSTGKYSIIEVNVAHNFKDDKTYNSLTYLQHKLGTTNINKVARELQNVTGESYMKTNTEAVKKAVEQARKNSTNDKSFEQLIKNSFNVQYCKLDKDSIKIADKEIKLSDIQHSKQDIIKDLQRNREHEKTAQQSTSHYQGYSR